MKESRQLRRHHLLETMSELESAKISCANCTGVCCTFVGNSMQVTPLEAMDLYQYLQEKGRWDEALELRLRETISHFRLDQAPPSDGRRTFSRRRYTCPFFKDQSLGCSIAPEYKPYGCLGFNAIGPGVKDGENCTSRIEVLEKRELAYADEGRDNESLREKYQLQWEKISIPEALLDLHQKLN